MLNPPSSISLPIANFSSSALQNAQNFMAKHIASLTAAFSKDLLSKHSWIGAIPEQSLWEGKPTTVSES
jgi:hypothetical protein